MMPGWRGESLRHSNARSLGRAGPVYRRRSNPGGYPESVRSILSDVVYRPETIRALKEFKRKNPWRGTMEQRFEKLKWLNKKLAEIYNIRMPDLRMEDITGGFSGRSSYTPALHRIVARGKLSVVTYLHEFRHAMGKGEKEATKWSVNLFRQIFPEQYARLGHRRHTLVSGSGTRG